MVSRRAWGTLGQRVAAGAPAWSPSDLPGLIAWYNFGPGNFTQTSGNITGVTDLSGSGHNLTQTGGNVPYNATGFNSAYPCAAFVAANDGALIKTSFGMGTGKLYTAYVAGALSSSADTNCGCICYSSGVLNDYNNSGSGMLVYGDPAGFVSIGCYRANAGGGNLSVVGGSTPRRFGALARDIGGGSWDHFSIVDGVMGTAAASGNVAFTDAHTLVLGTTYQGGVGPSYWQGPIAEVVLCNTDIGNTNLALLDDYYADKYSL